MPGFGQIDHVSSHGTAGFRVKDLVQILGNCSNRVPSGHAVTTELLKFKSTGNVSINSVISGIRSILSDRNVIADTSGVTRFHSLSLGGAGLDANTNFVLDFSS